MLKAILRKGVIVPLEPLPAEWIEGAHLEIDIAEPGQSAFDIDEWAREMNSLCVDSSVDDERIMHQAIEQHREQAKEQMRREMGLTA